MRVKTALALGPILLLFAAGCGDGDDGDGVASADGATASASADGGEAGPEDAFDQALAYSECMRENGVEDFPDPEQQEGGGMSLSLPKGIDPDDEVFKAAEEACEEYMPGPGEGEGIDPDIYEALVEYAECMRENGVEDFPDPEPGGGIRFSEELGQDGDFAAAEEACKDLRPEGPEEQSLSDKEDA
ncbi:hypothetical protein [Glycomyces arizonensis]|uniref:hypothetical protein n=1 Tax=Glycomyces arizonensis TaxID=256035 RepID=UPI00040CC811|nr:hypothetical protein [Glycomyces arizonensis]